MASEGGAPVPQSPETQPPDVREQLAQDGMSHDGTARSGQGVEPGTAEYMGAEESEVTPIMPPVRGPTDLLGEQSSSDDSVDPADEITPG